jgi:hypothetical protein
VRQRFGVTRDGENLFVRHHVRVIAEQFPTARGRDRFWLCTRARAITNGSATDLLRRIFTNCGNFARISVALA